MKTYLFLLAAILFLSAAKAQQRGTTSLNLYGGYTFKDKVNFDGFYGYVNEAFQYGGGLEFFVQDSRSVELKYLRMDTHLPLYGPANTQLNEGTDKGSVNYILIGGNKYFGDNKNGKVAPYAGADLGIGIVDVKDGGSTTKFAWDAKIGVKLRTSSAVSLKIQAYFQNIIGAVGSNMYITGGGAYVSVPDYVSVFQFGLGGALTFDFRRK